MITGSGRNVLICLFENIKEQLASKDIDEEDLCINIARYTSIVNLILITT